MFFKILSILLPFFMMSCDSISQTDLGLTGIHISRSPNYPIKNIKTKLQKVRFWQDSMLLLEPSKDSLASLSSDFGFFSINCKSLVFKEITYVNSLFWNFTKSDSRLILKEIHFEKNETLNRAYFMMNKNMPRYSLDMVGQSYFDWFIANGNIYFLTLAYNEGPEEDLAYLSKAKLKFQELLME